MDKIFIRKPERHWNTKIPFGSKPWPRLYRSRSLCRALQLNPEAMPVTPRFQTVSVASAERFCGLHGNRQPPDPLLKQVLPLQAELLDYPGYSQDPVGDLPAVATDGVIHKYRGRALFIVTGGCAIHCRYCFRRNFPYQELQLSTQKTQQAIDFITQSEQTSAKSSSAAAIPCY